MFVLTYLCINLVRNTLDLTIIPLIFNKKQHNYFDWLLKDHKALCQVSIQIINQK